MGIGKDRISAPLEAGPSLIDAQKLPPQVSQALEYVSDRLMRKQLHLTLVMVREEDHLARRDPQLSSPIPLSITYTLVFLQITLPIFAEFTQIDRKLGVIFFLLVLLSLPSIADVAFHTIFSIFPEFRRLEDGICRQLEDIFARASKKFSLGSDRLLAPLASDALLPTSPAALTLKKDLVRRSLQQNEVVFGSEGLTILAIDHVYTFKRALSGYSRKLAARDSSSTSAQLSREEELLQRIQARTQAVDELRLLVLSQRGRQISQSYLLRAYDHLSVSIPALRSVNEAYKSCFHSEGIEVEAAKPILPNPQLLRSISGRMIEASSFEDDGANIVPSTMYMGPYHRAPATPTGYEEVTPITRSEWNTLIWGRLSSTTVEIR